MSAADLAEMYDKFTDYAWRFEGHDVYSVLGEEERIAAFLHDGVLPRKTRENNGWIRIVEDAQARNATIGRVRVVGQPVTDYTRFEFAAYPENMRAGEDVQVISREQLDPAWAAVPDFWLFDGTTAFVQHFDSEGQFLGAEQVENVAPYLQIRELLLSRTVSARNFSLDQVPQLRGERISAPPALNIPSLSH